MSDPSDPGSSFRTALKEAKRWADFYSIVSIFLIVVLGMGAWYLGSTSDVDLATKIEMQIMMAGIVIVVSIWQAAACAVASLRSSQQDDRRSPDPEKLPATR